MAEPLTLPVPKVPGLGNSGGRYLAVANPAVGLPFNAEPRANLMSRRHTCGPPAARTAFAAAVLG